MELVRVTNLTIKLYNLDDLDKVFEKIEKINEKAVSRKSSTGISVAVEVDLLENRQKQDDVPPLYKMRLALSEALQGAANSLRYVPEDSVNGKRYDLLESKGNYTDRPEQDNAPCSKCSCKYAVNPGDKSIPRPPH